MKKLLEKINLSIFLDSFKDEYRLDQIKGRTRKFNPTNFLAVMMNLCTSTNREGAETAIDEVFQDIDVSERPSRQAFSTFRSNISFRFFADMFRELGKKHCAEAMPSFRGLKLIAIDGDQYRLYRSQELEKHGFRGFGKSNNRETRAVIMYGCTAVDMLSGVPIDADFSSFADERGISKRIIERLSSGKNQVFILDRLYLCSSILESMQGQLFVIRCITRSGYKVVEQFVAKGERTAIVELSGANVRLIRSTDQDGKIMVLATNLSSNYGWKSVVEIYKKRWEIETFNRDMTSTLAIEQFHSKKLNSILQELFAALIFKYLTSAIILTKQTLRRPDQEYYWRSNFKRATRYLRRRIKDLISGILVGEIITEILVQTEKSSEKRRANSRSNPREIRYPKKERFTYNSSVVRRQSPGRHTFAA